MSPGHEIRVMREEDLELLLPLLRAYCDFYEVDPSDEALLAMSRVLLADPASEGVQLLAVDGDDAGCGFATICWTWSTLTAARLGVMNDLYVAPAARGGGLADALIRACVAQCRERGATKLSWQTALGNKRAQAVYDRAGGRRSLWLDYDLPVS